MLLKRIMEFLPALLFLPLLHIEGGIFNPPEGADCQIANTGFPLYWLQEDGQCCSCHEGIVMCQEVLPCPQLPQNVAGCDVINVCGCDWLLCNDTESIERETKEEGGVNNPGQETKVGTYGTQERRKREVIENGDTHHRHHPNQIVGDTKPILKQATGGTKGKKGGIKGTKGKGGTKGSKGKGTSKGGKGKGKGTKGTLKGSKGKGTSKGKGKGTKAKGHSKGKGGKGGVSSTPTTPKGDTSSYDYTSYSDYYSYSYGDYTYTDYTYDYGTPKTKGKRNSRKKGLVVKIKE